MNGLDLQPLDKQYLPYITRKTLITKPDRFLKKIKKQLQKQFYSIEFYEENDYITVLLMDLENGDTKYHTLNFYRTKKEMTSFLSKLSNKK